MARNMGEVSNQYNRVGLCLGLMKHRRASRTSAVRHDDRPGQTPSPYSIPSLDQSRSQTDSNHNLMLYHTLSLLRLCAGSGPMVKKSMGPGSQAAPRGGAESDFVAHPPHRPPPFIF
jgi:hypothetical protein